jgi:hypothetical protein
MAVNCGTLTNNSPTITVGQLCGHSAERFAEIALQLEPMGEFWCKQYTTIKAGLYRAFGGLLSTFNERLCDLLRENTGCYAVETLGEWENEFGLPSVCQINYPRDIEGRQAQVCAARRGSVVRTLLDLQTLLRVATGCQFITLENQAGSVCIRGIQGSLTNPVIHNVVGGQGLISNGNGSASGQPLTLDDPDYTPDPFCPFVYHSTIGGWTGGMGQTLQFESPEFETIVCLMRKHLPAHLSWEICEE